MSTEHIFIMESELDAILLYQEAKSLGIAIRAVATGGTKSSLDSNAIEGIRKAVNIYLLSDRDINRAGIKACGGWKKILARARILPIINAKDLGDMQVLSRQGEVPCVQEWLKCVLRLGKNKSH